MESNVKTITEFDFSICDVEELKKIDKDEMLEAYVQSENIFEESNYFLSIIPIFQQKLKQINTNVIQNLTLDIGCDDKNIVKKILLAKAKEQYFFFMEDMKYNNFDIKKDYDLVLFNEYEKVYTEYMFPRDDIYDIYFNGGESPDQTYYDSKLYGLRTPQQIVKFIDDFQNCNEDDDKISEVFEQYGCCRYNLAELNEDEFDYKTCKLIANFEDDDTICYYSLCVYGLHSPKWENQEFNIKIFEYLF